MRCISRPTPRRLQACSSSAAPKPSFPASCWSARTRSLQIAAVDPVANSVASGVKETSFRVFELAPASGPFLTFVAPFTLTGADAAKTIEFFSRDNVLNTEAVKTSAVRLDAVAPELALLSPAACDAGICRLLKGRFPVLGTARDPHFGSYSLEYAPGQNAALGFALISSGTLAVSSAALGNWDTSALSGWQTLRLTATDLVQNASVLAVNVFVGDPGELMSPGQPRAV